MTRFGIVSEGVTDQAVLETILTGCCGQDIELSPLQPLGDETHRGQKESFGNWLAVLEYCASGEFEAAFQFVDYVIVHIDTDVCEETHFDVPRRENGEDLSPLDLINRVAQKLQQQIRPKVWEDFHECIIFAIAVDSIECWLLPLHARDPYKTRYQGCLSTLSHHLKLKNLRVNLGSRNYRDYQEVSKGYSKRRTLRECYQLNDGLQVFIEGLQERGLTTLEFNGDAAAAGTETE